MTYCYVQPLCIAGINEVGYTVARIAITSRSQRRSPSATRYATWVVLHLLNKVFIAFVLTDIALVGFGGLWRALAELLHNYFTVPSSGNTLENVTSRGSNPAAAANLFGVLTSSNPVGDTTLFWPS
jgi:hypothetical protein